MLHAFTITSFHDVNDTNQRASTTPHGRTLSLTCQHVIDAVIASCCQRQLPGSYSFQLFWVKTQIFALVGDISTEPHHRFELARGGGETYRGLGNHWSRGQVCSLQSCLGRKVARAWQKCAARSLLGRSDSSHVRGDVGAVRRRTVLCVPHHHQPHFCSKV